MSASKQKLALAEARAAERAREKAEKTAALRAHIAAVSKPGARIRVTKDLTRYDDRLTPGQVGTVIGPPRTRMGLDWVQMTGSTLVFVRFDCGAELDVICQKDVELVAS